LNTRHVARAALPVVFMLVAATGAADERRLSLLFAQPNATAAVPIDLTNAEREPESLLAAVKRRARTLLDEFGRVPPGAQYEANVLRRSRLKTRSVGPTRIAAQSITPASWVSRGPQNCGGRTRALVIDPSNTGTLYAGAASGGVWKSTDYGASWSQQTDFMTNININAMVMDPISHGTIYAATGELSYGDGLPGAGIFKTTDAGVNWNVLPATTTWQYVNALAIQPGTSGVLIAAKTDGLWRTADGGNTWTQVYTTTIGYPLAVAFDPSNANNAVSNGFGLNQQGQFYTKLIWSHDGGVTWHDATSLPAQSTVSGLDIAWGLHPTYTSTWASRRAQTAGAKSGDLRTLA
jgi:hypothetical protein